MSASFRARAIAALASFFILTPLPALPGAQPDRPSARPSFPQPELRVLDVTIVEPLVVFDGELEPVPVADEPEAARSIVAARAPSILTSPARLPPSSAEEFPGAVAVSVPRLGENPRWRRIIEGGPQALRGVVCANGQIESCAGSAWSRWHELLQRVSALEGEQRLQAANEGMNTLLTYATDDETYGVGDHWATLEESMERGRGDCEDIAIAKMWLLNAAGIDLSNLRLVVLKDTLRNLDHAVLSVVEDGHQYVLDNTTMKVGHADWMRGYRPIYALSANHSWIYGMRVLGAPPLQVAQNGGAVVAQ